MFSFFELFIDERGGMKKHTNIFHSPLQPGDTDTQTVGCRHTKPDICAKHSLQNVCAFVREDGMCMSPPASWAKQYKKLLGCKG